MKKITLGNEISVWLWRMSRILTKKMKGFGEGMWEWHEQNSWDHLEFETRERSAQELKVHS